MLKICIILKVIITRKTFYEIIQVNLLRVKRKNMGIVFQLKVLKFCSQRCHNLLRLLPVAKHLAKLVLDSLHYNDSLPFSNQKHCTGISPQSSSLQAVL